MTSFHVVNLTSYSLALWVQKSDLVRVRWECNFINQTTGVAIHDFSRDYGFIEVTKQYMDSKETLEFDLIDNYMFVHNIEFNFNTQSVDLIEYSPINLTLKYVPPAVQPLNLNMECNGILNRPHSTWKLLLEKEAVSGTDIVVPVTDDALYGLVYMVPHGNYFAHSRCGFF